MAVHSDEYWLTIIAGGSGVNSKNYWLQQIASGSSIHSDNYWLQEIATGNHDDPVNTDGHWLRIIVAGLEVVDPPESLGVFSDNYWYARWASNI